MISMIWMFDDLCDSVWMSAPNFILASPKRVSFDLLSWLHQLLDSGRGFQGHAEFSQVGRYPL